MISIRVWVRSTCSLNAGENYESLVTREKEQSKVHRYIITLLPFKGNYISFGTILDQVRV